MSLIRELGLLRWLCWFRPHKYYTTYIGQCSFDSKDGLSDITYSEARFCKYCFKVKIDEEI